MRKYQVLTILVTFYVALGVAQGASMIGYKQNSNSAVLEIVDNLMRVVETDSEFKLGFAKHAAFYRFPKDSATQAQARQFFNDLQASREDIKIKLNPETTEIFSIATTKKK